MRAASDEAREAYHESFREETKDRWSKVAEELTELETLRKRGQHRMTRLMRYLNKHEIINIEPIMRPDYKPKHAKESL